MAARKRVSAKTQALLSADALRPALATLRTEAPSSADYVHEIKLDGYRLLARVAPKSVQVFTRNGRDFSDRVGHVVADLARARRNAVLDGELVWLNAQGVSDFSALQKALGDGATERLFYIVFDALFIAGEDLRGLPLLERKTRLEAWIEALPEQASVRYGAHLTGDGKSVLRGACELGLEGIVSKRVSAPYRAGRVGDWLKIKCGARQEFVVIGFSAPRGTRAGFGALVLGFYEGKVLRYAGRVGTGFDTDTLLDLHARLIALTRESAPVAEPLTRLEREGVTWLRPVLVGEVAFTEFTADGRVRHAVWKGLRKDKRASEVVRESPQPAASKSGARPVHETPSHGKAKQSARKKAAKKGV